MYALRPIRPADRDALVRFHARLSEQTLYRRYHAVKGALSTAELRFLTHVDDETHVAVVAEDADGELAAVARVIATGAGAAEAAVVVADDHHGHGVGRRVAEAALGRFWDHQDAPVLAFVQRDNRRALRLFCDALGGRPAAVEDGVVEVRLAREPRRAA